MHTRSLLLVALVWMAAPATWAQQASTLVGPSKTLATPENSYSIAPGVVVTPLYQGAPTQAPHYNPGATQGHYTGQAYQSAQAPSYWYGTGATATVPASQTTYYQTAMPATVQGGTTPYDNTQYRFYMEQNGKQMSAQDFEAWMKARGIRIAGGRR